MENRDNEETYRKIKEMYSNNTYNNKETYVQIKSINTNTVNEILENIRELNND